MRSIFVNPSRAEESIWSLDLGVSSVERYAGPSWFNKAIFNGLTSLIC
jgi:hypothetical protein